MLALVVGRVGGVSAMLTASMLTASWYPARSTRSRRSKSRCWSACLTKSSTGQTDPTVPGRCGAVSHQRLAIVPSNSWDGLVVDTIRTLATDAAQKAGSGHLGTAMALVPAAYVLWTRRLTLDPEQPDWSGRSRSVLSNGCASVPRHVVLHLTGHDVKTFERRRGQASHEL
jgi:hypothetical protein